MDVVSAMRTSLSCTHQLTQLSDDDCLTIFRTKAFGDGGPRETQRLLDIGRRMVEKCKGVPLAVNALGGLLYSKHEEQEWESIEKSEMWSLLEINDEILPILRLSFDHLPSPSLKSSFAYCSIFPKDQVIIKDDLIQLWMGLGYLQPSSGRKEEMEELGNEYFVTLLRNSLFEEVEFDEYNNITSCKIHDLVHDLALHASKGTCLTLDASEVKNYPDVQHLSLIFTKETRLDISKENVGILRTLFLEGHLPQNTNDFKCIRALRCLEESSMKEESCAEELSCSIPKSIHLRYLDLTKTPIVKVPKFITKLYHLETLKLPYNISELPPDFCNLASLRHFYLGEINVLERFMELPRDFYILETGRKRRLMTMNIGQLKYLLTLPFFVVGKGSGHRIEELGSLSKLRGRLHVYDLQHVKDKEEAEKAQILGKSDIKEIQFHWDEILEESKNNHGDVLEGLKPHWNVKGLSLRNFGGRRWASWMSRDYYSLLMLVKIELMNCWLCEQVPTLGHLPHLAIVKMGGLNNLKHIGHEFYGQDECIIDNCDRREATAPRIFLTLSELRLVDMPQLEEWSYVSPLLASAASMINSFPCLQILEIEECPKLIAIPATFNGSTSLQRLSINGCTELTCLPEGVLQPTLVKISIDNCPNLKKLNSIDETEAVAVNGSTSLQQLLIRGCPELMCLPKGLLQPTLEDMVISWCPKLETPNPDALRSLTSLKQLEIRDCPNWGRGWEEGLFCTTNVRILSLGDFGEEYIKLPWPSTSAPSQPSTSAPSPPWRHLTSVKNLRLYGWPEVKSLPDQLEHLPALIDFIIRGFSGLESLPECLRNLSSLKYLGIFDCPLLEKRCEKGGEDWHKIAHIPRIYIDNRKIQGS
ncbi:putative disease resistance protein RGA4 [Rhododendron vialii]|uniref:putative disease resistance protein RGA4 n=1 Tax=Rhododendron vialii TaxID=182163 RepID=UPI00265D90BB|nr:putative disease resistance protein RGA4 [Rhododendron vialii]